MDLNSTLSEPSLGIPTWSYISQELKRIENIPEENRVWAPWTKSIYSIGQSLSTSQDWRDATLPRSLFLQWETFTTTNDLRQIGTILGVLYCHPGPSACYCLRAREKPLNTTLTALSYFDEVSLFKMQYWEHLTPTDEDLPEIHQALPQAIERSLTHSNRRKCCTNLYGKGWTLNARGLVKAWGIAMMVKT